VVTAFLLIALAIPRLALWLRQRGSHPLSPFLERLPVVSNLLHVVGEAPTRLVTDRKLLLGVTVCNGAIFLIDAGTLHACLLSLNQHSAFSTAFIAMIAASILVTLAPVPLGLGSFEAGSAGMLSLLGDPLPVALAATLLLRGFTLWLPLLPGLIMRGSFKHYGSKSRRVVAHR
jgi:uncharacterized protein (TIRG00374 family)